MAPTRRKLRRAVTAVSEILAALRLEKHPDKTFVGRIERGFDFLRYHFTAELLNLAVGTLANFLDRGTEAERPLPARGLCRAMVGLGERRIRRTGS